MEISPTVTQPQAAPPQPWPLPSQGTGFVGPASSHSMVPNVEQNNFSPTKTMLRTELAQLKGDMKYNIEEATEFIQRNNMMKDEKCEAILKDQQARFERTAQEWEQQSHDNKLLEIAQVKNSVEMQANDVFNALNARILDETKGCVRPKATWKARA